MSKNVPLDNILTTIRSALQASSQALACADPRFAHYVEEHRQAQDLVSEARKVLQANSADIILNDARWRKLIEQENMVYSFNDSSVGVTDITDYIDEKLRHDPA